MNSPSFVFLTLTLLLVPWMGRRPQQPQQNRDVQSAHEIGPFVVSWGLDRVKKEEIMSQVRGFLWDHLQNHSAGRFQITFGNLEGDPTIHTVSIQSGRKGKRVVRDQIVTIEAALLAPGEKPKRESHLQKYCSFERIDDSTQKSIPEDEKKSPESFKLRLKDCKGRADLIF